MKFFTTLLLTCIALGAYSQRITVSGYIGDLSSGEKLIGGNVYLPKLDQGTSSNTYGFYSITIPSGQDVLINYSYIGFQSKDTIINSTKDISLNIDLSTTVTLDVVEISAERSKRIERETQMSSVEIPITQIKKLPALLGEVDVLRVLQLLPGVKSGGEGQTGFYVRGGGPDQNLILLDGVPVYNASHLFGFFSVFNSDAIKDVKLIKGGYPARYGGRLSSVLDITLKEGNVNEYKGNVSMGLISSKATLEGPINKGKTSFLVSARRTYLDVLARPFIKRAFKNEGQDGVLGYYFYDLNAKVNHKFSDKDRLYFSSYLGRDKFYLNLRDNDRNSDLDFVENGFGWGNVTTALRWNHIFHPKLFMNTTATYSDYRLKTDFYFGTDKVSGSNNSEYFKLNYTSGIEDVAFKVDFDYIPSPEHFVRFGTNVINHKFKPGKFFLENKSDTDPSPTIDTVGQKDISANEIALYVEDDWSVSKAFKINLGLHGSAFVLKNKTYTSLQPRISARYLLPSEVALKASFATMRQYISLLSFEGIGLPTDIWVPSTERLAPQDSWQVAIGAAKTLNDKFEISIEGYYKGLSNLVAYKDGAGVFQTDDWQDRLVQGNGNAYGAEFFVQKKEGRFTGWVGYTLSWAYRQFDDIDQGRQFPYRFDRRHDLSLVGLYEWKKSINLSATWVFGTGNAVTLPNTQYGNFGPGQRTNFGGVFNTFNLPTNSVIGQRNNYRMPNSHRLDVGINFVKKRKSYTRTLSVGAYNAYANNNPFFLYFDDITVLDQATNQNVTQRRLKQTALVPFVPYINWSIDF